jgi:hypothetical protein
MGKCSNCDLETNNLLGPMADLCEGCFIIFGHTLDIQIGKEEANKNLEKRGDTEWKE